MNVTWRFRCFLGTICVVLLVLPCVNTLAAPLPDFNPQASGTVVKLRTAHPVSIPELLTDLATADVVYLGETHDRAADHLAQQVILQQLQQRRRQWAIGMEMFQRPVQFGLNQYLRGEITEAELRDRTDYKRRWGYDWEFYAPILRFAKQQQLPVIALNTPTEVTRKVARKGLDSLTWADKRFIPPRSAIELGPERYRERIRKIYAEIHQGNSHSLSFESFFQAQVLWDETMADRIAQFLQQQPGIPIVVLVGQGHLLYGEGIPRRVARRLPAIRQVSVLLNPAAELRTPSTPPIADYFWDSAPPAVEGNQSPGT